MGHKFDMLALEPVFSLVPGCCPRELRTAVERPGTGDSCSAGHEQRQSTVTERLGGSGQRSGEEHRDEGMAVPLTCPGTTGSWPCEDTLQMALQMLMLLSRQWKL